MKIPPKKTPPKKKLDAAAILGKLAELRKGIPDVGNLPPRPRRAEGGAGEEVGRLAVLGCYPGSIATRSGAVRCRRRTR